MILFLIILVAFIALLIVVPAWRERFVEGLKSFSDSAIVSFLRATSRFGAELTEEGWAELVRWREQRLRNLRGLSLRARERARRSGGDQTADNKDKPRSDLSF
jgi:DNA-binding PadR family transcriptional regulator